MAHKLALRQFKLVQTTLTDLELLYIPQDETFEIAQDRAQDIVDRHMAPGFRVRCVWVSELPKAPSGKYLWHECLVWPAAATGVRLGRRGRSGCPPGPPLPAFARASFAEATKWGGSV